MRIAIVNDSLTAVALLKEVIAAEEGFAEAWVAVDGSEAVQKCRDDVPDIILMDLVMPVLGGVEATRQIMRETPCPILVVTGSVEGNVSAVFEAMGAGAVDAVTTPAFGSSEARRILVDKIRSVASIAAPSAIFRKGGSRTRKEGVADACVLIGSSAGGPAALMTILEQLPASLRAAVIIVQHIDARFDAELASWLDAKTQLPVRLAEEGEEPPPGEVVVSRGGRHLTFSHRRLRYTSVPDLSYQPSVDVLFESAVTQGTAHLMGVVLTGMGRDGARGLMCLRTAGHLTIAQDEATAAIYGMPRAATENGAAREVLPLDRIASRIEAWSNSPIP
ncbi:two-component system, chemotaxis family [Terrimicrobium sacchariphilum]|uniref:Protein-glutamate methylesterase/protein-glutamine glutaminase n=1 Tax=Terrimicrobium sacchariphilum TaxID=690879 RepID=A0A146GD27_TERSA|nr:chemotaxis-specific protein-glutamate methyltransferase CheB [Terrimicrobium sacchariphilum]GAT35052.1 two-component system, chemotaxis family [Terrimicrobium sacchariphilum]